MSRCCEHESTHIKLAVCVSYEEQSPNDSLAELAALNLPARK